MGKFKFFSNNEQPFIGVLNTYLQTVDVNVGQRRIRAQWTPELAQDLGALYGIDAEAELTAMLAREMGVQIDRNILNELIGLDLHERILGQNKINSFKFFNRNENTI
jgi:hypothetical protein